MGWKLLILLLLLLPSAYAQFDQTALEQRINSFMGGWETTSIIEGSYASKAERLFVSVVREQYSQANNAPYLYERDGIIPEGVLVILGGPMQSPLAKSFIDNPDANIEREDIPLGAALFITTPTRKVVVVSDNAGFVNLPRTGPENSPLAKLIPVQLVPVVAAGIGLGLLTFWKLFLELGNRIGRSWIAAKIMKFVRKRTVTDSFMGVRVKGVRLKLRETISILLASIIFGVAISFNFFSSAVPALTLLIINIVAFTGINAVRNAVRLIFDKVHNIHTEYVVWYYGATITVLTGWLGALFGVAGYTVTAEGSGHQEGRVDFWINVLTFFTFIASGIANLIWPSILLQMFTSLALAITFLQLLPFSPFAGRRIFAWSQAKWWMLFMPALISYIFTVLII